eukprot:CAMPEP_0198601418 /NCGR_PEP_ID=MMETSP1462-20131121/149496_1 /TAXON_ID=1333877 /ORGANISM="Brandtodinium nutriculum, Strain RCC3387" /LENGTH=69 /DNA_ID=CAMNT_0044333149 /DNA_START=8 /DNA_END=214 /DNA_ORIENTATION=-
MPGMPPAALVTHDRAEGPDLKLIAAPFPTQAMENGWRAKIAVSDPTPLRGSRGRLAKLGSSTTISCVAP